MAKPCGLKQRSPVGSFRIGDSVYYIGSDSRIGLDYGNQVLQLLAIDALTGNTVCETVGGRRVVGVHTRDLAPHHLELHPVMQQSRA